MKKSSLLALSLVSLVSLVGCGKSGPTKVSAAKFDETAAARAEALEKKLDEDPDYDPFHYYGLLTYNYSIKFSGSYVDEVKDVYPGGKYEEKLSFHIIYAGSFGWIVDPDDAASLTDEEYELYSEIVYDATWFDSYVFIGFAELMEAQYEEDIEAGIVSISCYLNPFKLALNAKESIDFTDEDSDGNGSGTVTMKSYNDLVWNDVGEAVSTSFSEDYSEKYNEHKELNGGYVEKESYSIKYLPLPEKYQA